MQISETAKKTVAYLIGEANVYEQAGEEYARIIQQAIDEATAEKTREIERLNNQLHDEGKRVIDVLQLTVKISERYQEFIHRRANTGIWHNDEYAFKSDMELDDLLKKAKALAGGEDSREYHTLPDHSQSPKYAGVE
jgi:TRAP-type C4-dicarboxylate transport system substrate-binding protein